MAVKTEKELSEDQRAHWLKAVAAIELRNFGYAISLLQGILKQEPQFLTGRQLLRRTEVTGLQSDQRDRSGRCRGDAAGEGCLGARFDEERGLGRGCELS